MQPSALALNILSDTAFSVMTVKSKNPSKNTNHISWFWKNATNPVLEYMTHTLANAAAIVVNNLCTDHCITVTYHTCSL